MAGVLVLGLGSALFVAMRVQRVIDTATVRVEAGQKIPFDLLPLPPASAVRAFQPLPAPAAYVSGTVAGESLWVGGAGGLTIHHFAGGPDRFLLIGLDLPPAPIVALSTVRLRGGAGQEVVAATHGAGLLLSPGQGSGVQLLPREPDARDVTALLPLGSGDLLLGTRDAGLLVYRATVPGAQGSGDLHPFAAGTTRVHVSALAGDEGDLWIGTRDRGLLHWHGGQMDTLGLEAGLPDLDIESLAAAAGKVYAGTPRGVVELGEGRVVRVLAPDLFARSLTLSGERLLVSTVDQGPQEIALDSRSSGRGAPASLALPQVESFVADRGSIFAIASSNVYAREHGGAWNPMLVSPATALTDRDIAALHLGSDGRLWVGYFNRGLDVWNPRTQAVQHFEDDHVFCVNRIVDDPLRHTVDVATANGLALFEGSNGPLRPRAVLSHRDGLIADHVTDVAFRGQTTVLATPAGLTFLSAHGAESLYAFQGLANNHVYTLAAEAGEGLVAGTLGGLSFLHGDQVQHNTTVANSGLRHNWVTALLAMPASESGAGGQAYLVGTYGAGVMGIDGTGHVFAIDGATSKQVVNPNAMIATPTHVFAGTLSGGLLVFSRAGGRWSTITDGLPSHNVTALAAAGGVLYVGTDNGLVRLLEAGLRP